MTKSRLIGSVLHDEIAVAALILSIPCSRHVHPIFTRLGSNPPWDELAHLAVGSWHHIEADGSCISDDYFERNALDLSRLEDLQQSEQRNDKKISAATVESASQNWQGRQKSRAILSRVS